tara:strand:+ start:734 stop:1396 length:663 start_codon:yes stop_codon:yes gene_type:complete
MFDSIAKNYDFLNHSLSFCMDFYWRRKAISKLKNKPKTILDIATGTADFAIAASKIKDAQIVGIDISKKMLEIGNQKIKRKGLDNNISLQLADSENLPFSINSFDAVTVGFGVRNFENLKLGLSEIYRVMKKDSIVVILEPSKPKISPIKEIYDIYFHYVLPFFGRLISKNNIAYQYLPNSVNTFPKTKDFLKILKEVGFSKYEHIPLTFGIIALYIAIK